jgi:sulfatase modifying factor 1
MSDFDPYHKWLGIPETERPISKYRLLGIVDFEADRDVISTAAERQTVFLRTLQAGEHEVLVADLLNEVSQARVTLLNADQKTEYDEQLRRQRAPEAVPEPTPPPIPVVQTPAPVVVRGTVTQDFPVSVVQTAKKPRRTRQQEVWKRPVVIGVSVVGVIGVFILVMSLMFSGDADPVASNTPPVVTSPLIPSPQPAPRPTTPQPTASNETLPAKVAVAPPLAVAPFDAAQATAHQQAWSKYLGVPVEYTNSIGMKFMLIPPGKFIMGPKTSNSTVIISKPFYLGKYEVTKGDYYAVTKNGNEQHSKSRFPVTDIHSISAINFCKLLSSNTGQLYRLPTEAEWEHCCKAGTSTVYHFGEKDDAASEYAWYEKNSGGVVHVVGQKSGNRWGIFDLLGNCREWCLNFYYQYASGEETDPMGPVDGKYRVLRGGSYDSSSPHIRSDWRSKYPVNYVRHMFGFRVVLEIPVRAQPNTIAADTKSLPASLQQGLVAYYPFNGNANDESGNGHHGTSMGGETFVADRHGNSNQAFSSGSNNSYITVPDHNDLDLGNAAGKEMTISLWFNAASGEFLCKQLRPGSDISSHNIDYRLYVHANKPASHVFGWGTGPSSKFGGSVLSFSGVAVPDTGDGWNHLVVTYSQTVPGSKSLFFDGGLVYLAPIGKKSHASNLPLNIGPVKGALDDIRIYNRALSEAEVKALYDFESKPPASSIPTAPATESTTNTIGMTLNKIPGGTFLMGSPVDETDRESNETQHKVTITKPFYMQTTEVTQEQWTAVMGTEPWKGKQYVKEGPDYAATYVSWDDALAYCEKLSEKEGKTYRLPTEAEWEYACRAGTKTTWSFGDDEKELGDYAWYKENASHIDEKYAHQVRLKDPNPFGLHDMHGNVWEWCHDHFGEDYYRQSPVNDPQGPTSGAFRVFRGGSWYYYTRYTRSASHYRNDADNRNIFDGGFRLVRELD